MNWIERFLILKNVLLTFTFLWPRLLNSFSPQELGLIRKPASFMTSICDERGQELIYAGMPITEVFKEEMGLGGVLGLLWFQRRLEAFTVGGDIHFLLFSDR